MKIYLDSCILIYLLEGENALRDRIQAALREEFDSEIWTSDLVRLECRIMPLRHDNRTLLEEYDRVFARFMIASMSPLVFDTASELRARCPGVKTPDALHLAAALSVGCMEFWTNDARLTDIVPAMRIRSLRW